MAADGGSPDLSDTSPRARRLGRSGLPLLVGLAGVALLLGLAVIATTLDQRAVRRHATANANATRALTAVRIDLLDAETGQRGYMLTGNSDYLGPYIAARARMTADLERLERAYASSDMASDPASVRGLLTGIRDKQAELDRTVQLYQAGSRDAALAIIRGNSGQRAMEALRVIIGRLSDDHERARNEALRRIARADTVLLPLQLVLAATIVALVIAGFGNERRRVQATRAAQRAAALRRANDRNELLLRELNHRVKNIFSVIMAIIALAARRQPAARGLAEDIRGRVHALALAHSASLGESDVDAVSLRAVLERSLEPYRSENRVAFDGPDVLMPIRAVTPLGLILHELATNAVKHGALSGPDGAVEIDWNVTPGGKIEFRWIETLPKALSGGTAAPDQLGFGTTMIDLAARQLNGSVVREWRPEGLALTLAFESRGGELA